MCLYSDVIVVEAGSDIDLASLPLGTVIQFLRTHIFYELVIVEGMRLFIPYAGTVIYTPASILA